MTTWNDLFRPGDATNFFDPPPPRPFNGESAAFDGVNAWWLAELSRLVYRDDEDRKDFLARVQLEELDFIDVADDTQGFVVAPPSKTWAAFVFRGTSTPRDFLALPGLSLVAKARLAATLARGATTRNGAALERIPAAVDGVPGIEEQPYALGISHSE